MAKELRVRVTSTISIGGITATEEEMSSMERYDEDLEHKMVKEVEKKLEEMGLDAIITRIQIRNPNNYHELADIDFY